MHFISFYLLFEVYETPILSLILIFNPRLALKCPVLIYLHLLNIIHFQTRYHFLDI